MDDKSIVQLLSQLDGEEDRPIVSHLENLISNVCLKALEQNPVPQDLLNKIAFYKANLKVPIRLDLSGSKMNDDALKLLYGLPVRELELLECPNLTGNCLPIIGQMETVKVLRIGSNEWVDDGVLEKIPSNIKALSLAACPNFTGQGLAKLIHVRSLDLFGCNHLQDEDGAQMSDQLESLNLSMCRKIGEKTIHKIASMTNLKDLSLIGDANFTDSFLDVLPKSLLVLNLSGCSLSEGAFKAITKIEKLEELALCNTDISGEGLSTLPLSLVRLHLDGCKNLRDKHIIPLADRKNLKYLGIDRCPNITGEFSKRFNTTQIEVDWQPPQASNWAKNAILRELT